MLMAASLLAAAAAGCASPKASDAALAIAPDAPPAYRVFFDLDSAEITTDGAAILDQAVSSYRQLGTVRLVLAGHADRSGSERHNRDLSGRRAAAVRDYLLGAGVAPSSVEIEAHGERQGLVATPDGTVEPQNRRVEIFVRPD